VIVKRKVKVGFNRETFVEELLEELLANLSREY
jgi:hypothetical protein